MKKTAMITGASRGIGRSVAMEFAAAGYNLILTCHHSVELLALLKEDLVSKYTISCQTYIGDISNNDFVSSMFTELNDIDVLVNNAGISYIGLLSEMNPADWHRVMDTNLTSAFLCSKYAIPSMVRRKSGKIINISSAWGTVGASMEVAYSASKAGLNGFTKALAKELAPSNIQVNAIACGIIDTDMNRCFSEDELHILIQEIPANRLGKAVEAGLLAVQLATGNEYLTGQIIGLDGGWI